MDNLQEAYLSVYEATAMAKRGYDETAIRQQIAKSTGGGETADRATKLADKPTYGQRGVNPQARQNLARKQRGDFRSTTSSSPGLHGYGHKSDDPKVKAKQAARGAQRGVLTPAERQKLNREEFDFFDYLLEYLVTEGYADTNENAIAIMANMSEEWRAEIIDEANRAERELGLTSRQRERARNLNQYTDKPIFYDTNPNRRKKADNSDPILNKAHKGMTAKRQASHKAGRHLRGDTGESGNVVRSRYQANKDHKDGYPSIRRVDT